MILTSDGKRVDSLTALGPGSLSFRYKAQIEGEDYFLKTFLNSEFCTGTTSRNLIKNEISVYDYIRKEGKGEVRRLAELYKGPVEIEGILCISFDYVKEFEGKSLWHILDVKDSFDLGQGSRLPHEQRQALIRSKVTASGNMDLNRVLHIIYEITKQARSYHEVNSDKCLGIIHADISPANVIVYEDQKDQKERAYLFDLGLARQNQTEMRLFFNRTQSDRRKEGNYYMTKNGITVSNIYSPPQVSRDYTEAGISYDTYNICNLLCLMSSKKLADFWWSNPKEAQARLNSQLKNKFNDLGTEKIAAIILKGTNPQKELRYLEDDSLENELASLHISPPKFRNVLKITRPDIVFPSGLSRIIELPSSKEEDLVFGDLVRKVETSLEELAQSSSLSEVKIEDYLRSNQTMAEKVAEQINLLKEKTIKKQQGYRKIFRWFSALSGLLLLGVGGAISLPYVLSSGHSNHANLGNYNPGSESKTESEESMNDIKFTISPDPEYLGRKAISPVFTRSVSQIMNSSSEEIQSKFIGNQINRITDPALREEYLKSLKSFKSRVCTIKFEYRF